MLGSQIAALMPSVFLHLAVTVAFAGGAWFLLSKTKPEWKIPWAVPVILGATFSLYSSSASVISLYQNQVLFKLQQAERAQNESASPATAQNAPVDPKLQLKAELLKHIDDMTGSSEAITPAGAKDFFGKYDTAFSKGEIDRGKLASSVIDIYQCQQYFYEDALASYKSHKAIKSDERERCEKEDGSFFNREKLIPAEMAKGNSDAIDLLAQRKPLTDAAGKPVEINETSIRAKLESQMHRIDAARHLFAAIQPGSGGPKPASVGR